MNACFTSSISLELEAQPTNVLNQAHMECSWLQQLKCSWPKSQRWYFPAEGRDLSNGMCDWFWKVAMARTKAWESFDKRLDVWKALACPSVARWPMLNFWIYKYPKQFSLLFFVPAFCQQIWKVLKELHEALMQLLLQVHWQHSLFLRTEVKVAILRTFLTCNSQYKFY